MARISSFSQSGAPIDSPVFTGIPEAPTAPPGTNNNQVATTAYADTAIANLIDSSPEALNTLNELAGSLGNNPDFAGTVIAELGSKASLFDLLDHSNDTTGIHGIADTADLITTAELTDVIAATLVSAEEAALVLDAQAVQEANSQANSYTDTTVASEIIAHSNQTQNVHGILDTSALATDQDVTDAVAAHNATTTNVHGILDTANLLYSDTAISVSGLTNSGNTTLGDSTADRVTFTAQVNSNVIPSANGFDLGTTTQRWDVFAQDATVYGNTVLGDSATVDTIVVNGLVSSNLVPTAGGTRDLGTTANPWRNVYASGIYLGGVDAVNRLDDYEEGTFTPTVTINNIAQTTSINECTYTKVGNLCNVAMRIKLSSQSTNGQVRITNLPFPTANVQTYPIHSINLITSPSFAGIPYAALIPNSTTMNLGVRDVTTQAGANMIAVAHVDADTEFRLAFTYQTS